MNTYKYKGELITASSKKEAISKITAGLIWGVEGLDKLPNLVTFFFMLLMEYVTVLNLHVEINMILTGTLIN